MSEIEAAWRAWAQRLDAITGVRFEAMHTGFRAGWKASRDALLSDKAVEAAAKAMWGRRHEPPEGIPIWGDASAKSRQDAYRVMARAALTAAVESVERGDEDD